MCSEGKMLCCPLEGRVSGQCEARGGVVLCPVSLCSLLRAAAFVHAGFPC
jgi:hypothetical protein